MADSIADRLIRDLAILLIVRVLQVLVGICALVGFGFNKYPESVLAVLFCIAINTGIPRQSEKE